MDGPVLDYASALKPSAYDAVAKTALRGDGALTDAAAFFEAFAAATQSYAQQLARLTDQVPTSETYTFRDAWDGVKGEVAAMSEAMAAFATGVRAEIEPLRSYQAAGDGTRRGLVGRGTDIMRDYETRASAARTASSKVSKIRGKLESGQRDAERYEAELGGAAPAPAPAGGGRKLGRMFSGRAKKAKTAGGLDKLREKADELGRELAAAERTLAAAEAELAAYEPAHAERMAEVFAGFEVLERGRLDSLKAVMEGVGRVELELADTLKHIVVMKKEVLDAADPAVDQQRFLQSNVSHSDSWARISGNRPVISTDVVRSVASTATVAIAAARFKRPLAAGAGAGAGSGTPGQTQACSHAGCPVLTRSPDGLCPSHSPTAQAARAAAAASTAAAHAEHDWTEQTDAASGRTYFYNAATGATQWHQPEGWTGRSTEAAVQASSTREADHPGDGWVLAADPSTGREYWYNESLGESRWREVEVAAMSNPMHG